MSHPFTQVTLKSENERTFDTATIPLAAVEGLRGTIENGTHKLPKPYDGYSILSDVWVDEDALICAAHATLLHGARVVALLSAALSDHEAAWALWGQHIETVTASGKLSDEALASLEERIRPALPWLLVSPIDSTLEESDWLDDFSRAWATALKMVASEQVAASNA